MSEGFILEGEGEFELKVSVFFTCEGRESSSRGDWGREEELVCFRFSGDWTGSDEGGEGEGGEGEFEGKGSSYLKW